MNSILNQLKAWRDRFDPKADQKEDASDALNKAFARIPREALDYLIGTYFKPVEFIGPPSTIALAERNGQMAMMVDILQKVDMGQHPMLYKDSPSSDDDKPMDVRQ